MRKKAAIIVQRLRALKAKLDTSDVSTRGEDRALATAIALLANEDRWARQSAAFRDERPWAGWMVGFSADSDWDTTQFVLEKLVGLSVLLTTADGRSRPVRITEWQRVIREDVAGIVAFELETTNYEPITGGAEEEIRYEDIREICVF